ncbi:hypothetical protein PUN28_011698 [Cardiocondyla obscurior]|uniref:Uncharacterized protein n=1 Tax=Cardiocondyla obscurior TaxID=286306 RepID=A0AAW2FKU5_9HYME
MEMHVYYTSGEEERPPREACVTIKAIKWSINLRYDTRRRSPLVSGPRINYRRIASQTNCRRSKEVGLSPIKNASKRNGKE